MTSLFKILLNYNKFNSHSIPVKRGLVTVPSFSKYCPKLRCCLSQFPVNMNTSSGTVAGQESRKGPSQTHYYYCKSTCPPEGESHIKLSLILHPYFYSPDECVVTLL